MQNASQKWLGKQIALHQWTSSQVGVVNLGGPVINQLERVYIIIVTIFKKGI